MVTCCERADLLALLCVAFSCNVVLFPYGVQDQVYNLIISIPDRCLGWYILSYSWYMKPLSNNRSNHNIVFLAMVI